MRVAFGAPPCLLRSRRPRRRSRRSRRRSRSGRPPRTEGLGPPLFSPSRPFRRSARAFRRVRAAPNARGRGWDASPRRDEIVSVCPYARPYAHFSPKSARGSHHICRRCCTRFGADEADEEKMNRKTLDFPHPSSCSNFPNSNVLVDIMTPPNVGLKRTSYQIFRRSGFRQIRGNCQRVFLTAKNHEGQDCGLRGRKYLDFLWTPLRLLILSKKQNHTKSASFIVVSTHNRHSAYRPRIRP